MPSSRLALVLTILMGLAAPGAARAFECGSSIVAVGDSSARVLGACGRPVTETTRTETRTVFEAAGNPRVVGGVAVTITVQVDVWVYDFGPGRFMQELTFENGVLVRTRTFSRG